MGCAGLLARVGLDLMTAECRSDQTSSLLKEVESPWHCLSHMAAFAFTLTNFEAFGIKLSPLHKDRAQEVTKAKRL